jgi:hypothetical protein
MLAMSSVIERLTKISTVPDRSSGAFDAWIEQNDAIQFLEQNSRESEFLVYLSLGHNFLQTVLTPSKQVDIPDMEDLLKWDFTSNSWGVNYRFSDEDPTVWITVPLESAGSESLRGCEKLVFNRSFEGYDDRKSYIEILQKFTHIFDLHFVPHTNSYCRLDKHGDIEKVITCTDIPTVRGSFGGKVVTVDHQLLDDYMVLTDSTIVRAFDFTCIDSNFPGWGKDRKERSVANKELGYRITVDGGIGGYMRGVQVVRTRETIATLHHRLTHEGEGKKYASFIAQDWKNGGISEISCGPGHTANYFTKSDLPFELSPAFFRPEVLGKYKADPKKYKLEERSIGCRGSWHLQTYDINEAGQVHTYLIYLRYLPYEEQLYWKSFNEAPKGPISKRAVTTDMHGDFYTEYNALQSIRRVAHQLAEQNVPWWALRAPDLLDNVHYPATTSNEEWANELMALDKLLVEGFEEKWLRGKAIELGQAPLATEASLLLVTRCLRGLGFDDEHAKNTVSALRLLHHLRTKLKGHASGDDAHRLREAALARYGSFRKHFEALCGECDLAMQHIVEAFAGLGPARS